MEVRVYRGRPNATKDPRGYGANRKQASVWSRNPKIIPITRPLRYPLNWPAEREGEKGIDVSLAVDMVKMAVQGKFDVGIVMSADTDRKPALEAIGELSGNPYPQCEVAAWINLDGDSRRLRISQHHPTCHWLDQNDYSVVADRTSY